MSNAHGAVMGWAQGIPVILKSSGAAREPVTAIRVADFKDWSGDGLSFDSKFCVAPDEEAGEIVYRYSGGMPIIASPGRRVGNSPIE